MVARHIPSIMVIGAVLVAYRLLGVEEWLIGSSIKSEIKAEYDYIISMYCFLLIIIDEHCLNWIVIYLC